MGVFRSHLKQGGPSDVNPETEVTSNFYGYHIYVSFWRARYWLAIGGCRSGDPDSSAYLRPRLNQDRRRAGG